MDGRARVAFSGLAAFAVTATVVATVATTNAAAFADAPGTVIDAAVVDVTPTADAVEKPDTEISTDLTDAAPVASVTADPVPVDDEAERLVAPAPAVVPTIPTAATSAPVPAPDVELSLREALASDDAEAVYAWAAAHGWSRERIERFLAPRPDVRDSDRPDTGKRPDERHGEPRPADGHSRVAPPSPPVQTGSPAVTESPQRGDGSKRDRSPGSPDHRD